MKVRQTSNVTIRGSVREKRTERAYEAFFISVFLLSLFLTGCSQPMQGRTDFQGKGLILQATGEATLPPSANVLEGTSPQTSPQTSPEVAPEAQLSGMTKTALLSFASQEAVQERVRLVVGWLKFVRQSNVAQLVEVGWDRVKSGQVIEPLNNAGIADRPEVSKAELMLWRQILHSQTVTSESVEALSVMLAVAATPDDLLKIDNLVIVSTAHSDY